jgi:uncharacterized protein YgiM (DUF1202 family)
MSPTAVKGAVSGRIGGLRMYRRLRQLVATVTLLTGLVVTPLAGTVSVAAQDDNARTISLDVFRCPPGVTLQEMVADDCIPVTSGVDVILTAINGTIAPLTISNATLDGNTFRWNTTSSGSSTDEWGFKHSALPEGTTAFLVQGDRVVSGQTAAFEYRFTTGTASPSASLDMYLLMSADTPVIEPPSTGTTENTNQAPAEPAIQSQSEVTPEPTAGLRPSPTPTTAPPPVESEPVVEEVISDAPVEESIDDTSVAPADTGDIFVPGDEVVVAEGPLNLRAAAGTGSASVGSLPIGTQLTILAGPVAATGYNWYQVKSLAGQTGWVIVDALDLSAGPNADFAVGDQVVVFDGPINLRAAAGTGSAVVKSVAQESLLTILGGPSAANGYAWYQVQTTDGVNGWVAANFIEKVAQPNPSPTGEFAAGDRAVVVDGPANLRSAAGTANSVVAVLKTGDTMTVTAGPSAADGYTWYRVTTQTGSSGWVAGELLDKLGWATGDIVYVNTDSLNVRSEPGLNGTVLDTVYKDTTAVITGGPTTADSREWYRIDVSGVVSGWVAAEYLALSDAPPVTPPTGNFGAGDWIFVTDPPLNLRATPSTSGQILASLTDGDGMLVLGETTLADGYAWNQVENDGITGYVAREYVSGGFALGEVAIVVDGPINLRAEAGTGSAILQSLPQGAQVSVLNVNPQVIGGVYWFQITTTDSVTGWVAGRYLGPVVTA